MTESRENGLKSQMSFSEHDPDEKSQRDGSENITN